MLKVERKRFCICISYISRFSRCQHQVKRGISYTLIISSHFQLLGKMFFNLFLQARLIVCARYAQVFIVRRISHIRRILIIIYFIIITRPVSSGIFQRHILHQQFIICRTDGENTNLISGFKLSVCTFIDYTGIRIG